MSSNDRRWMVAAAAGGIAVAAGVAAWAVYSRSTPSYDPSINHNNDSDLPPSMNQTPPSVDRRSSDQHLNSNHSSTVPSDNSSFPSSSSLASSSSSPPPTTTTVFVDDQQQSIDPSSPPSSSSSSSSMPSLPSSSLVPSSAADEFHLGEGWRDIRAHQTKLLRSINQTVARINQIEATLRAYATENLPSDRKHYSEQEKEMVALIRSLRGDDDTTCSSSLSKFNDHKMIRKAEVEENTAKNAEMRKIKKEEREKRFQEKQMIAQQKKHACSSDAAERHRRKRIRVPEHFNTKQLVCLMKSPFSVEEFNSLLAADLSTGSQNGRASVYNGEIFSLSSSRFPLTKQLVLLVGRAIEKLVKGALVPREVLDGLPDKFILLQNEKRSKDASTVAHFFADNKEFLAYLFQRMIENASGVSLSLSESYHALEECIALHKMAQNADTKSRKILHDETYQPGGNNTIHSNEFQSALNKYYATQARSWYIEKKDPFEDYRFTQPLALLDEAKRQPCQKCNRSSYLYCPFCLVTTLPPSITIPHLNPSLLPVSFDIYHHGQENIKKSTSLHSCIICPDKCALKEFPYEVPSQGYDPQTTLLLYPTDDAYSLSDPSLDIRNVNKIIVVESTWAKGHGTANHSAFSSLRRIRLNNYETTFWRNQECGSSFLATLEAIFYAAVEFYDRKEHDRRGGEGKDAEGIRGHRYYDGRFDDIMYLYAYQHLRISHRYEGVQTIPPPYMNDGQQNGAMNDGSKKNPKAPKCWSPWAQTDK